MAPKAKKPKVKKGKVKDVTKGIISTAPYVSEKEKYLQKEYAILTEHVRMYTERVRHFQWENQFLDKEAQQIQGSSKVYLSYLTRRTIRCQNAIISLNDQNRSDLAEVRKQKEELISHYTKKEKEVRHELMEMETKLSIINKEIEALQPWQELQMEQLTRIRELEKELLVMKVQHTEQMYKLKTEFLQLTAEYEMESQQKLQSLAKLAEKEAVRCLIQHMKQVKADNWRLQHNLLDLIKQVHVLKGFLFQLREQQHQLLQEHQYRQDLARMRSWLRHEGARPVITLGSPFRCRPEARSRLISPQVTSAEMLADRCPTRCTTDSPENRNAAPAAPAYDSCLEIRKEKKDCCH